MWMHFGYKSSLGSRENGVGFSRETHNDGGQTYAAALATCLPSSPPSPVATNHSSTPALRFSSHLRSQNVPSPHAALDTKPAAVSLSNQRPQTNIASKEEQHKTRSVKLNANAESTRNAQGVHEGIGGATNPPTYPFCMP